MCQLVDLNSLESEAAFSQPLTVDSDQSNN